MIRKLLRKWLGIEELQAKHDTVEKELKLARSRPLTMQDRMRKLERRSFIEASAKGSPFASQVPPGVRAPQ